MAMSGKGYPTYLLKFITDVQSWMEDILAGEELRDNEREILMPYLEEPFEVDMDNLFSRLEWAEEFADVIPSIHKPKGMTMPLCLPLVQRNLRMAFAWPSITISLWPGRVPTGMACLRQLYAFRPAALFCPYQDPLRAGRGLQVYYGDSVGLDRDSSGRQRKSRRSLKLA